MAVQCWDLVAFRRVHTASAVSGSGLSSCGRHIRCCHAPCPIAASASTQLLRKSSHYSRGEPFAKVHSPVEPILTELHTLRSTRARNSGVRSSELALRLVCVACCYPVVVACLRVVPVQDHPLSKNLSAGSGRWGGSAGDSIKGPTPTNP